MAFKKGQSGNPNGRPKGAVDNSFRVMLEDIYSKHGDYCKAKLEQFLSVDEHFKWMCEKKAQFELKSMPTEVGFTGEASDIFVSNILKKLGVTDEEKA